MYYLNNNRCLYCNAVIPEGRQLCWSCERTPKIPKPPSEKQIRLAEDIAHTLDINFPLSSKDFTARTYFEFIKENINEAKSYWSSFEDYDDLAWIDPLNP